MGSLSEEVMHRITIVGGGAGGLELAVRLGKKLGRKKKALITILHFVILLKKKILRKRLHLR